jgi:hypothetical protein
MHLRQYLVIINNSTYLPNRFYGYDNYLTLSSKLSEATIRNMSDF